MEDVDFILVKGLFPNAVGEYLAAFIEATAVLDKYGIKGRLRTCHFLAQIGAETGGLRVFEESLNYSALRLTQVWPRHFPTIEAAEPYAHNDQALGNYIYGRTVHPDLGNMQAGDGYKFRGRGLLQITGRAAYQKFGDLIGASLVDDPRLAFDHRYSLAIAAAEFSMSRHKGIGTLTLCDKDDIEGVTFAVNGGQNGIDQRRMWLGRAKTAFDRHEGAAPAGALIADSFPIDGGGSRAIANADRVSVS